MARLDKGQLEELLNYYIEYIKHKGSAQKHFDRAKNARKFVKDKFLDLSRLKGLTKEQVIGELRQYVKKLEGPSTQYDYGTQLEDCAVRFPETMEYILQSEDSLKERIHNILHKDGKYNFKGINKQFWTSIFTAVNKKEYPNWAGRTEKGLKELGFVCVGGTGEKYLKIVDAFKEMQNIKPELDFDKLDYFMDYITAVPEGIQYLERLKKRIPNPDTNNNNGLLMLLSAKKQIILYGPPGTGKTYNTKSFAVKLLAGIGEDGLFEKLERFIMSQLGATVQSKPTLAGQYSVSTFLKNNIRFAFVRYPGANGSLSIHLKKVTNDRYPAEIALMPEYKKTGFAGYTEFKIKNNDDLEKAKLFIKFAFENS